MRSRRRARKPFSFTLSLFPLDGPSLPSPFSRFGENHRELCRRLLGFFPFSPLSSKSSFDCIEPPLSLLFSSSPPLNLAGKRDTEVKSTSLSSSAVKAPLDGYLSSSPPSFFSGAASMICNVSKDQSRCFFFPLSRSLVERSRTLRGISLVSRPLFLFFPSMMRSSSSIRE